MPSSIRFLECRPVQLLFFREGIEQQAVIPIEITFFGIGVVGKASPQEDRFDGGDEPSDRSEIGDYILAGLDPAELVGTRWDVQRNVGKIKKTYVAGYAM